MSARGHAEPAVLALKEHDLRGRGLWLSDIDAPMVIDDPINGHCFLVDVRNDPALSLQPGDIVNMHNLESKCANDVTAAGYDPKKVVSALTEGGRTNAPPLH